MHLPPSGPGCELAAHHETKQSVRCVFIIGSWAVEMNFPPMGNPKKLNVNIKHLYGWVSISMFSCTVWSVLPEKVPVCHLYIYIYIYYSHNMVCCLYRHLLTKHCLSARNHLIVLTFKRFALHCDGNQADTSVAWWNWSISHRRIILVPLICA